ncbi:might be a transmembrane protein [Westerdykella ornata]|uniref:Might be a transmembrane protein n=1 Tax=Westerdykella ornata TaxID=318751 RepID=A0A6A6J7P6_WESOR|nr:might be a transmembrane protein [Westerdykella ornata]KAF2272247.1 might be a transmembrane protein [Westerdykella ornata]
MVGLSHTAARVVVSACNFISWVSSIIVVGITGYLINNYTNDMRLIYWMVISTMTLAFWIPSFILPWLSRDRYHPWYFPLNLIFSYLWLTAFIFAAQAYNRGPCRFDSPRGARCSLKRANEAFMFIPFFFMLVAVVADFLARGEDRPTRTHPEKDVRPSADTSATTGHV